jgi:hypothetical protein
MYLELKNKKIRKMDYNWEKSYEVIKIANNGEFITKENSKFPYLLEFCVDNLHHENSTEIHSVKRLKDDKIFTLGDNLIDMLGHDFGKITKFWPSFEQLRVDIGRGGYHLGMM